jgi:heme oxygenase-like protein
MSSVASEAVTSLPSTLQTQLESISTRLLDSLPNPDLLTAVQRRTIVARYAAVLEGNFIYWMTGAYIAARTQEARAKIFENLHEEIRDAHPAMMRRFAIAAHAVPTDVDAAYVYADVSKIRAFIGRLSPLPLVVTMAFFEGFIQRFMPYLADLAKRQGSSDFEYTDVHGVCDITHTQELFRALDSEMGASEGPAPTSAELLEGVELLRTLIANIIAV